MTSATPSSALIDAFCDSLWLQDGLAATSLESWNGFLVPAKTPKEIIDKLAKHVIAAAKDPANVAQLTALGATYFKSAGFDVVAAA